MFFAPFSDSREGIKLVPAAVQICLDFPVHHRNHCLQSLSTDFVHFRPSMAAHDHTPETVATLPPENTTGPMDRVISEPEEAHEKPRSVSSNDSVDADLEKQQAEDEMPPAEPIQSNADSIYPGTKQTAIVMLCLCLTIFLVALVGSNTSTLQDR